MNKLHLIIVALVLSLQVVRSADLHHLSSEACAALGFSRETLACSSCEKLKEFVKDSELFTDCLNCCEPDQVSQSTKFASATLAACKCVLPHNSHLDAFVNNEASKFKNLKFRWVNGMQPVLELHDTDGRIVQTVGIGLWKTENIVEFLREKLISLSD